MVGWMAGMRNGVLQTLLGVRIQGGNILNNDKDGYDMTNDL